MGPFSEHNTLNRGLPPSVGRPILTRRYCFQFTAKSSLLEDQLNAELTLVRNTSTWLMCSDAQIQQCLNDVAKASAALNTLMTFYSKGYAP